MNRKFYISNSYKLSALLAIVAIIISIVYSYNLKWLGDDIFIGFRYIQNFTQGKGLVFNVGEKVEGYTDFLWLMVLSVFSILKLNIEITSQLLGIFFSTCTLIIFSIIPYKVSKSKQLFIFPFVVLSLALNYDYNVWATSGLETSFFTFLLSAAFYSFFFSRFRLQIRFLLSGFCLTLALLTRPDAILILVMANVTLIANQSLKESKIKFLIRYLLYFNLSFLTIYIPYFIMRYHYYGYIFPNTYYAKLAYETCFDKGLFYFKEYCKCHFTTLLIALLPTFIFISRKTRKSTLKEFVFTKTNSAFILSIIISLTYIVLFVMKVGGDFMYARLIIPMVPFFYYIIFHSITLIFEDKRINILFIVITSLSIFETNIRLKMFREKDINGIYQMVLLGDIADERDFYINFANVDFDNKLAKELNVYFEGIDAKALVMGAQVRFAYYANFKYCQEYHGLTDITIAHSKVKYRSRIGHEKHASIDYLEKKGINFSFTGFGNFKNDYYRFAQIILPSGTLSLEILTYNSELMNQLSEKLGHRFNYTNIQTYIDNYILKEMPYKKKEDIENDYNKLKSYYFNNNKDFARKNCFVKAISNLSRNGV